MVSNRLLAHLLNASSALAISSILLGTAFSTSTWAMDNDQNDLSSIPQIPQSAVPAAKTQDDVPQTQTRSIFKSIMGQAPFTKESLVDLLKQGAPWLQEQNAEFRQKAAEQILMLDKIEAENPNLVAAYSGAASYIGALNDVFTALDQKMNKRAKAPDQYVFRSPEYFNSPYDTKDVQKLFAKVGEKNFDRKQEIIDHVMCVTFSLLSTIENACESTLGFWSGGQSYAVKKEMINKLLGSYIESTTGLSLPNHILNEKTDELLQAAPKTGVLYQILIHPEAVDDALLVTRAWGVPLVAVNDYSNVKPTLKFMSDIKTQPDSVKNYMVQHSESFKETCTSWRTLASMRSEIFETTTHPTTLEKIEKVSISYNGILGGDLPLADVTLPRAQGRLVVNPKETMDPEKFTIKKHYWHEVSEGEISKYNLAVESFVDWIMEQKNQPHITKEELSRIETRQLVLAQIKQTKQVIEGVSNGWTFNPYTQEDYSDREAALQSLNLKLIGLSEVLSQYSN